MGLKGCCWGIAVGGRGREGGWEGRGEGAGEGRLEGGRGAGKADCGAVVHTHRDLQSRPATTQQQMQQQLEGKQCCR
jgi:hypothetical protein